MEFDIHQRLIEVRQTKGFVVSFSPHLILQERQKTVVHESPLWFVNGLTPIDRYGNDGTEKYLAQTFDKRP